MVLCELSKAAVPASGTGLFPVSGQELNSRASMSSFLFLLLFLPTLEITCKRTTSRDFSVASPKAGTASSRRREGGRGSQSDPAAAPGRSSGRPGSATWAFPAPSSRGRSRFLPGCRRGAPDPRSPHSPETASLSAGQAPGRQLGFWGRCPGAPGLVRGSSSRGVWRAAHARSGRSRAHTELCSWSPGCSPVKSYGNLESSRLASPIKGRET